MAIKAPLNLKNNKMKCVPKLVSTFHGQDQLQPQKGQSMENRQVNNITSFLPARDFDVCSRFYEDLGFDKTVSIQGAVRYEIDGFGFWLKDYYVKEYADNTMLCIYVADVRSWYKRIVELDFPNNYGGSAKVFSEPHSEHGSLIMQIGDPSGVLWHIYEGA